MEVLKEEEDLRKKSLFLFSKKNNLVILSIRP